MNEFWQKIAALIGIAFGLLVIGFTSVQTWSLLFAVSDSVVTASLGLALFEGGMLYWWFVFLRSAKGLLQMALSILAAVFCLVLVIGATALHLDAVDMTAIDPSTPARLIVVASVVSLIAKFLMPIFDPTNIQDITDRAMEGKIMQQAYKVFNTKISEISGDVADDMAAVWTQRIKGNLMTRHQIGEGDESAESKPDLPPKPNVDLSQYPKGAVLTPVRDESGGWAWQVMFRPEVKSKGKKKKGKKKKNQKEPAPIG